MTTQYFTVILSYREGDDWFVLPDGRYEFPTDKIAFDALKQAGFAVGKQVMITGRTFTEYYYTNDNLYRAYIISTNFNTVEQLIKDMSDIYTYWEDDDELV